MKFLWCILFIISLQACKTQPVPPGNYSAIEYFILLPGIQVFETDVMGNLYVVDSDDRILKFDTTGQLAYKVVNLNLGDIHSLDAGNPFKILAFYRDQQTIVLYDNTLSEIQRIPLAGWGLQDVTAACLSPDNAIWLFEGSRKVLMKMNSSGNPIITSDPFDILGPESIRPDQILDDDHWLIVKQYDKPIALFNDFGNFLSQVESTIDNLTVFQNKLIVNSGNVMRTYALPGGEEIQSPFTNTHDSIIRIAKNRYVMADQKGIYFYPL